MRFGPRETAPVLRSCDGFVGTEICLCQIALVLLQAFILLFARVGEFPLPEG